MAVWLAFPPVERIEGELSVPASKSGTNRALLLAAWSRTPVVVENPLASADADVMARALVAMGAQIEPVDGGLRVCGPLGRRGGAPVAIDLGESGTAARFLAAAACVAPGRWLLDGAPRLRERPMAELLVALRRLGARIVERGAEGFLPVEIEGATLVSGRVEVDASRSSQFVSALLLAGAALEGGLEVSPLSPVVSEPYVEVTLELAAAFGHPVERGASWRVRPGEAAPQRYRVTGDWSSALPLLAAAGTGGGQVTLTGLSWPSSDADARAARQLPRLGVELETSVDRIVARRAAGGLRAAEIDAAAFPDAVPTLAALAACAAGTSRLTGIAHLRWKESDRIAGLRDLLSAAGAACETGEAELSVRGGVGGAGLARLPTRGDHRLAMAAGLLSLARPATLIEDPAATAKSYPGFFRDLARLCVWRQ